MEMICPSCGSEYREGFARCADCDVDLLPRPEDEPPPPDVQLVKIFESGNAAVIPLIESLLADAGIEFMTKGEPLQDLFGWGRFGTNFNLVIGPVQFFVREDDVAEASEIVSTLANEPPPITEEEPAV